MENSNMNKEKKEVINLINKNDDEIFEAYVKLSKESLEFYEFLKKYDDMEVAIKEYEKVKKLKFN